jgi:DNA primase
MDLQETILQMEVTKLRRNKDAKEKSKAPTPENESNETLAESITKTSEKQETVIFTEGEEKELLRLILNYGNVIIGIEAENEEKEQHEFDLSVSEYILFELMRDRIDFLNPIHQMVLDEYMHQIQDNKLPDFNYFKNHLNPAISTFAVELASASQDLSEKWNTFGVMVDKEIYNLKKAVQHTLYSLKEKRLSKIIYEMQEELKTASQDKQEEILKDILRLTQIKVEVNKLLGRIVVK